MSDSEDEFFKDISSLRRRFGLSNTPKRKRQEQEDISVGSVSSAEIAALLTTSPAKRRANKSASPAVTPKSTRHRIPPRTPQSRVVKRALSRTPSLSESPISIFSQTTHWSAAPLSPSPSATNNNNGGGGLLGSLRDAMITDQDLATARRKLGQEQAITQQQIMRETRQRLVTNFSHTTSQRLSWLHEDVSILCQFYTFGCGKLASVQQDGVYWQGELLGPIASIAQTTGTECRLNQYSGTTETLLFFPWSRTSAIRRKSIDDHEYIMITVDEDMGIAFRVGQCQPTTVGKLVEDMSKAMSQNLGALRKQDDGLLSSLLAEAKRLDPIRFGQLSIDKTMNNHRFVGSARESIRKLCIELAMEASDSTPHIEDVAITDEDEQCKLCFADFTSVVLLPCQHRVCESCLAHLQTMYGKQPDASSDIVCVCPWDRTFISQKQGIQR